MINAQLGLPSNLNKTKAGYPPGTRPGSDLLVPEMANLSQTARQRVRAIRLPCRADERRALRSRTAST